MNWVEALYVTMNDPEMEVKSPNSEEWRESSFYKGTRWTTSYHLLFCDGWEIRKKEI